MAKTELKTKAVKLSKMPAPAKGTKRIVRVRSDTEGFRRAGIKHSTTAVDHPADDISDAQFEQLVGEPKLFVEVLDLPDAAAEEAPKK